MHKVISISLNGNAYQLDEGGYDEVREYLARAAQQLHDNPDRAEIMADLEQAIADKCHAYLGPHKTVVSADEVSRIVSEMGPVDTGAPANGASASATGVTSDGARKTAESTQAAPARRLFRIPDGALVAGVCTGLAAFLHVDVVLVRVAFIAAALLTKGAAIIAYVVAMFVIPEARTPEERAATSDAPFNAREVIERAKTRSKQTSREWRQQWRQQRREWRHQWRYGAPGAYPPPPLAAALVPVFGLARLALFLVMMAMLISLVTTGAILDWHLPPDIPLWAGVLILIVGYQVVVSPLRIAQHWTWYPAGAGPFAFWNAVVWLIGIAFAIWLASDHIPEIREFLQRMPDLFRDFIAAVRDLFER